MDIRSSLIFERLTAPNEEPGCCIQLFHLTGQSALVLHFIDIIKYIWQFLTASISFQQQFSAYGVGTVLEMTVCTCLQKAAGDLRHWLCALFYYGFGDLASRESGSNLLTSEYETVARKTSQPFDSSRKPSNSKFSEELDYAVRFKGCIYNLLCSSLVRHVKLYLTKSTWNAHLMTLWFVRTYSLGGCVWYDFGWSMYLVEMEPYTSLHYRSCWR